MARANFVHLHVHSHYSLLDGAAPVDKLVQLARQYRMPALAITDHGNMHGAVDLYSQAIKKGVKPIMGMEAYVVGDRRLREKRPTFHLVLLALDKTGYQNLVQLSTRGWLEGLYRRPRIDWELLTQHHQGLLAMTACIQGEVPQLLLNNQYEEAARTVGRYQDLFGRDNFYLELQDHGMEEERRVLPRMLDLARRTGAPVVATNDSHYLGHGDARAHEVMLCLQTQTTLADPKHFRFSSPEFYFKSPVEMSVLFKDVPDALTNSLVIADKCNVQMKLGGILLPDFPKPEGKTADSYLAELCEQALPQRYPEVRPEVRQRLETELAVIKRMGFADYFLIVWDVIAEARRRNVSVGPGRGSAAGSLVAYLLRITDIEPLRYGLLFERFLNPDRISMPDIDIDFSDTGRGEVIEYVKAKYGIERVSQIATFNCIQAKLAVRDVGRVLSLPQAEINRVAKMLPDKGGHLAKALATTPELKAFVESGDAVTREWFQIAGTIDGLVRNTSIHAAGIVIARDPLRETVPLYLDKSQVVVTQFEKNAIEKIGLLKMDFLGLKTLSIIDRTLAAIAGLGEPVPDLERLTFDDPATYQLLGAGTAMGVFQLESEGMRKLLMRLRPSVFEDLIALLAMYRPGPLGSGMVDDFVDRKHGRKPVTYPHPELEPILRETYGVFLYQEQCMQTANVLAGFTMGQADQLRKAMAKKIRDDMEKMGRLFVDGAARRGVDPAQAQAVFDLMASFAEYGFNKSHSAAYAVVTWRTAWLKTHYPTEFMCGVLGGEVNDTDKLAEYITECRDLGIEILPPDINRSDRQFTVPAKRQIRYGLAAVKNVGEAAIDSILAARASGGPFTGLGDFCRRIDLHAANQRVIESLIKAGAFDGFGLHRSQLLAMLPAALQGGQLMQKEKERGQATFLDLLSPDEQSEFAGAEPDPPPIPEMPGRERLAAEKEALGLYLSGDPFGEVARVARLWATHTYRQLAGSGGERCRIAGLLTGFKRIVTKKQETMAFAALEADGQTVEVAIFPDKFAQVAAKLVVDQPLFLVVTAELRTDRVRTTPDGTADELRVAAEEVYSLEDLNRDRFAVLRLRIPPNRTDRESYRQLHEILKANRGVTPLTIELILESGERVLLEPSQRLRVRFDQELIRAWEDHCGARTVGIEFPGIPAGRQRRQFYRAAEGN